MATIQKSQPRKVTRKAQPTDGAKEERQRFDSIVIVVVTSSKNLAYMAYRLHANAYLVKPPGMDDLVSIAKSIKEFWIIQNQSPSNAA
jgi:DNA-binding LytR/AlgR family response regulator